MTTTKAATPEKKVKRSPMRKLTFSLSERALDKLQQLADAKTRNANRQTPFTRGDCLRSFIRSSQPGGGDWVHPMTPKVKKEEKK